MAIDALVDAVARAEGELAVAQEIAATAAAAVQERLRELDAANAALRDAVRQMTDTARRAQAAQKLLGDAKAP